MSDSALPTIAIAITPMHRTDEGVWENGRREGAAFFLVELVHGEGAETEVLLECRDERSAALAARVAAATVALLGLAGEQGGIAAFDSETAAILAANLTPEVALPSGAWQGDDDEEEEGEEDEEPARGKPS